jgi:glycosyltransferase involved in cell wall biosynthesis
MRITGDQHPNRISRRTLAVIGNHLPRQCGIATFTTDLLDALASEAKEADCYAVVMNDKPGGYPYPTQVRFELEQMKLADYPLAADFLNINNVDVACLQHEYGIFGGEDGAYILKLLNHLRMPVVTTLHTVLQDPTPSQRNVMKQLAVASDKLVVMAQKARELLGSVYGIDDEKIEVIPHGIPDVPFVDPNYFKDQFGVAGRKVLLTFGLLSPGKGIEYMIDALPEVVKEHPETIYMVLGETHPHVKASEGESYRLSLQRRARRLDVEENIVFHDRFVDLSTLCEFLGAADLYITPYLNREQITSGTLAYALGTGKAMVSTGYWYAEELLADGRGRIVPFADAQALASEVCDLLSHDVERYAIRRRAYDHGRQMIWKEVARRYLKVFDEVLRERRRQARSVFAMRSMKSSPTDVPELKLDHLYRLTDDVGILQHASFIAPNRFHGYCTDDNARALITVLLARKLLPDRSRLLDLACAPT